MLLTNIEIKMNLNKFIFITSILYSSSIAALSIQTIIQQKGQPTWQITLPNGNKLYTYLIQIKQKFPAYTTSIFVGPGGQSFGINVPSSVNQSVYIKQCSITYEVNKKGIVINTESSGNC